MPGRPWLCGCGLPGNGLMLLIPDRLAIMDYGQQQDVETGGDNQTAAFVFIAIAMAMTGVVLAASLALLSRRRNRQHRLERRLERVLETLDGATPRR